MNRVGHDIKPVLLTASRGSKNGKVVVVVVVLLLLVVVVVVIFLRSRLKRREVERQ